MSRPIWYDSAETGAPTLNNVAGSLLEVLRACLVNGFNLKSVTNIVVASGVATATAATHGYSSAYGKLLRIEGAPVAGLNGDVQPLTVDTNTFTYAAAGVPDGTYTGTITARRAPLGWVEAFTGTNVAIFARSAPEATAMLLRVNDSNTSPASATDARVLMVESASSVDSWTNESPQNSNLAGGLYWHKGANSTAPKRWAIIGNSRFIFFVSPAPSSTEPYTSQINYFGDLIPYQTPAPYDCVICGATSANATSGLRGGSLNNSYASITENYAEVIARSSDLSVIGKRIGKHGPGVGWIGASNNMQVDSSPVVIAWPIHVSENNLSSAGGKIRGEIPGLSAPLARAPFSGLPQFSVVSSTFGQIRKYVSVLYTLGAGLNGNALIDISSPWHE